ncbi:nucleoside triphosphate pyrophosphohydrolase family protein [Desulfuromonas thiophila]|uniref:nucleoside triphosphate pyrophosphohydrolase family protein n=1 Tax=Desulfuromonas thiophila TaxID=57664 RepID=UPI0029F4886D|nr:nucleoside triphosphate pyrophosphohydrolase family protein [Desulfuromonas thiophila]
MDNAVRKILNQYQKDAARTLNRDTENPLNNYLLGIMGEVGEVIDVIKKHLYHGHDLAKLPEEVGDCCWYLAAICTTAECGDLGGCWRLSSCRQRDLEALALDAWTGVNNIRLCFHCVLPGPAGRGDTLRTAVGYLLRVLSAMCEAAGGDFLRVLDANIEKLWRRYPEAFSAAASRGRATSGDPSASL